MSHIQYVCGFIMNGQGAVLMIKKNRPAYQAGTWNGIGGKVEPGESPIDAMVRECKEESNITTAPNDWTHTVTLYGKAYTIYFYRMDVDRIPRHDDLTDEEIQVQHFSDLLTYKVNILPLTLPILALQLAEGLELPVKLFRE